MEKNRKNAKNKKRNEKMKNVRNKIRREKGKIMTKLGGYSIITDGRKSLIYIFQLSFPPLDLFKTR